MTRNPGSHGLLDLKHARGQATNAQQELGEQREQESGITTTTRDGRVVDSCLIVQEVVVQAAGSAS